MAAQESVSLTHFHSLRPCPKPSPSLCFHPSGHLWPEKMGTAKQATFILCINC
ncbi:hypothetical protein KSP40_PGU006378 [Platanthera guangdongensis]|uniref:Uncharacterized protein n=1 Tax=Platanthera guangdongensis TaxID=2320717 RepID=A0ABR2LJF8_9ASPA